MCALFVTGFGPIDGRAVRSARAAAPEPVEGSSLDRHLRLSDLAPHDIVLDVHAYPPPERFRASYGVARVIVVDIQTVWGQAKLSFGIDRRGVAVVQVTRVGSELGFAGTVVVGRSGRVVKGQVILNASGEIVFDSIRGREPLVDAIVLADRAEEPQAIDWDCVKSGLLDSAACAGTAQLLYPCFTGGWIGVACGAALGSVCLAAAVDVYEACSKD